MLPVVLVFALVLVAVLLPAVSAVMAAMLVGSTPLGLRQGRWLWVAKFDPWKHVVSPKQRHGGQDGGCKKGRNMK